MVWFSVLGHLIGLVAEFGPACLLTGAAVGAAALVTLLAGRASLRTATVLASPRVTRRILRQRSDRVGVPRHRDPDASGRCRPRAPTSALLAAA